MRFEQTSCGTLTIERAEAEFDPGLVTVGRCASPIPETVTVGDAVELSAAVQNDNDQAAVVDVQFVYKNVVLTAAIDHRVGPQSVNTAVTTFVVDETLVDRVGAGSGTVEARILDDLVRQAARFSERDETSSDRAFAAFDIATPATQG